MPGQPRTSRDQMARWLSEALPGLLPPFLVGQRWFGGKARHIAGTAVEDAVLFEGDAPAALVVVVVSYDDGASDRYGLVVGFDDTASGRPVLGPTRQPGLPAVAVEAAADEPRMSRLLAGFSEGRDLPTLRGGRLQYLDISDAGRRAVAGGASVRPVGTEQSNTSLRVGSTLVFKLFRRLPAGENPEVEVGRFLNTRTSFRDTPALHGSLAYVAPDGTLATAGVLQAWVTSRGDGWSHVTSQLQAAATDQAVSRDLSQAMRTLGRTTAAFHAALASDNETPAFRPETVEPSDLATWRRWFAEQSARSIDLTRRHHAGWSDTARHLGETCLSLAGRLPFLPGDHSLLPTRGLLKIRVHGDYHLGQTLKTPDGFAIIDFEGEPSRPIDERREKHSALKDVAGMLRSFDYAIETACRQDAAATETLRSAVDLRAPFLDAYLAAATEAGVSCIPSEADAVAAWLSFFEFEKALYELEYEINNRPTWVDIPLRWITRSLAARGGAG